MPVVGRAGVAASLPVGPRARAAAGMTDAVSGRGYFNSSVTLAGEAGAASTVTAGCSAERI